MNAPLLPPAEKILTVGQLTRQVKEAVEAGFPSVWVSGEVSNCKKHTSGHVYLTLKDSEARLDSIIYRGIALRMKFDLKDGMEVIARGRLNVYVPHGKYQLSVEELHPKGIGALELAFQQLKEKLSARGYFHPKRKKPLPRFPCRVVLVTSPTGAAVRDMLETLGRRWPAAEVWVCPVPVQGDGAGAKIAEAISRLNRIRGIDVLILGRGGGSLEDLWAFNEECVANALFTSRIPAISGVGHETDYTIADMVADVRAETPTAAAVRAVPDRGELAEGLRGTAAQLRTLLLQRLERATQRLADLARQRCLRLPLERVRDEERRLDDCAARLERALRQKLVLARQRVETGAARLETLSPLNVLARGYSLTCKEADGSVVRDPEQVRPGDRLVTTVQNGRIVSRVDGSVQAELFA
jgi:exodeoxyribonuclease VII large subunit